MKLYLDGNTRVETGEAQANLLRKGWLECIENPPAYDPATQRLNHVGWTIENNQAVAQYTVTPIPAAELKQIAFDAAIAAGYDTQLGWSWALYDDDRKTIADFDDWLMKMVDAGLMTLQTQVLAKDNTGVLHTITVQQYHELYLSAGGHYVQLWETKNS